MKRHSGLRRALVLGMAALLAGCDAIPPEYERQWIGLQKRLRDSIAILTGQPLPLPEPSPSGSPSGTDDESYLRRARDSRANAELLRELYQVVYMREPEDRAEFGNILDSINQGASFEGIYNGFTHSAVYRKLEMANSGASTEALKVFGRELALFEAELPSPVEFAPSATQPLAMPVDPAVEPAAPPTPHTRPKADGISVIEYGKVPEPGASPSEKPLVAASPSSKPDVKALADRYSQQFVGASIFTLKRILGDEALKVLAIKREYPEKLAHWYAKWVGYMAGLGVDFGVSLRNKADESFHYKWAIGASEDRVNWEVLNRVHRVLNQANRSKQ